MLKMVWIRHGATSGNREKRYIGTTDEGLCAEGMEGLLELKGRQAYPTVDQLFVSPLKRCIETAEILFPESRYQIVNDFRECDFGAFENKNYRELEGNKEYQRWVDSGGTLSFPRGEHPKAFQSRCVEAFHQVMSKRDKVYGNLDIGFVVHGGTIMSIMERLCSEKRSYFEWQVQNGEGFVCNYVEGKLELCYSITF